MNRLNFQIPDGLTTLELRKVGTFTYRICGLVGCDKERDRLLVQRIEIDGSTTAISYAECFYDEVESVDYSGLTWNTPLLLDNTSMVDSTNLM